MHNLIMRKDLVGATRSTVLPEREAALLTMEQEALKNKAPTELRPIGHHGAR
jgi:hypothetical protein